MSVVNELKRGTIPLGKRETPIVIDHPLADILDIPQTQELIKDAADYSVAYLRTVTNPSLEELERYVMNGLKEQYPIITTTMVPNRNGQLVPIKWIGQLPKPIQLAVNTAWNGRPRKLAMVAKGHIGSVAF